MSKINKKNKKIEITTRPYKVEDRESLDQWRDKYWDADLEVPHGYSGRGVETVIAEKQGEKIILSLTGVLGIILDPLITNPDATEEEKSKGLRLAESVVAYIGQIHNAQDSYIAVPEQLTDYIRLLKRKGYEQTVQKCVVMRKPLTPEVEPRLGEKRDELLAKIAESNKVE